MQIPNRARKDEVEARMIDEELILAGLRHREFPVRGHSFYTHTQGPGFIAMNKVPHKIRAVSIMFPANVGGFLHRSDSARALTGSDDPLSG